jgi:16S rRNA (cytidine1402-2'-O)-methyltransferase
VSRLTLVPTPIGNLEDITRRALHVLREADVVAAEDTRRSRVLLDRYGIATPLERLDAHTMEARAAALLERHEHVAYVTDAGTPGVSDPGAELVRRAVAMGVEVEALPGPTAFVPALVLSGLSVARFTFEGFLPRKGAERRRRLAAIAEAPATTVLYEAPQRLPTTLRELALACGNAREASVSRELTKRFETTVRGTLAELAQRYEGERVRGEIVVVVGPAAPPEPGDEHRRALEALTGAGVRGATLRRALEALGVPRNDAYAAALRYPDDADA